MTLLFVCLAWTLFRSPDFATALGMYAGQFGFMPLPWETRCTPCCARAMPSPPSWESFALSCPRSVPTGRRAMPEPGLQP